MNFRQEIGASKNDVFDIVFIRIMSKIIQKVLYCELKTIVPQYCFHIRLYSYKRKNRP